MSVAMPPEAAERPSEDARLQRFLGDVHIEGAEAFRIADGPRIPVGAVSAFAPSGRADPSTGLRDALAAVAYWAAYARRYEGGGFDLATTMRPLVPDPGLMAALDAANPGRAGWEPGWRVFRRDHDGAVHASKGERAVRLEPGRYAAPARLRPSVAGDEVERRRDRASLEVQRGLYYMFGEAAPSDYDDARMARFYFDAGAEAAPWLAATLGATLNRYLVPFSFKCPVDPSAFDRLDSAVLYVARRYVPAVVDLLWPSRSEIAARLRGGAPLWTRRLLDGLSLADDPGTGESFGQSRCALLAGGVVDAWARGRVDPPGRLAAVTERFRQAGLDFARPHLALGLRDLALEPVS